MKTLDIEIALMNYLKVRRKPIVPNVSWGIVIDNRPLHECDLLVLSDSNYATEIEIKITKQDLLKDKDKRHGHYHHGVKYLYYAVPSKLKDVALAEIPDRAGLYTIHEHNGLFSVYTERKATANKFAIKWSDKDRTDLLRLGTMRIFTLKRQLQRVLKKV